MHPVTNDYFLTGQRFLTGLIGAPIARSASPAMHEWAARALGVRCHYHLIEVAGAGREELRNLFASVRLLGFAGVNVTFPYKEAAVELLDELSPHAAAMQAVNTVVVREGRLIGHNTDTTGFARAAKEFVEASKREPVALVGAGGVGKAIAFALAHLGVAEIRIFDSDAAKTKALATALDQRTNVIAANSIEDALRGAAGLVNGTPVGMLPNRDSPCTRGAAARRLVGSRCRIYAAMDTASSGGESAQCKSDDRAGACGFSSCGRLRIIHRAKAVHD